VLYFDHNATSPLSDAARNAWLRASVEYPANPSSPHRMGARSERALDEARLEAAEWLGCSPFELVWTSGATEAANACIYHAAMSRPGKALISSLEHPCVLAAAQRWYGDRMELIPAGADGCVQLDWLTQRLCRGDASVVAVMAANNETGVLQPWRDVLAHCHQHKVPYACDVSQWIGKLPSIGLGACDYLIGCAHKFGGPVGVGFMKVPKGFVPWLIGGPQEHGRRAGTENVCGILAMMAAWTDCERRLREEGLEERIRWRAKFVGDLRHSLRGTDILADSSPTLWNTVAALLPATADCRRRWIVQLDKAGVAASTGSACSSGKATSSHVLQAMGVTAADSDRLIRFSAGWVTTAADWEALLERISELERAMKADSGVRL